MHFLDEGSRPPSISLVNTKISRSGSMDSCASTSSKAPKSPTDRLLSPCSRRLEIKRCHSKDSEIPPIDRKCKLLKEAVGTIPFPVPEMDLVLGSSSNSRKEVVDALGWSYRQMYPDIDEKAIRTPDPYDLPVLIAEAKGEKILRMLREENEVEPKIIITADQIVLFENEVREKPGSYQEAIDYLNSYSNKSVSTISAVAATHYPSGTQCSNVDIAIINWSGIPFEIVEKVVAKGEIYACAGGFKIEDPDLNPYIVSIEGKVDSVLGLPVNLMVNLVSEVVSYLVTDDEESGGNSGRYTSSEGTSTECTATTTPTTEC